MSLRTIERIITYEGELDSLREQLEGSQPDGVHYGLGGKVRITIKTKEGWSWKRLIRFGVRQEQTSRLEAQ